MVVLILVVVLQALVGDLLPLPKLLRKGLTMVTVVLV
jgi:hypothetical protein